MATIYYYTSTGNSLYITNIIAQALGARRVFMNHEKAVCNDNVIGFVFPSFFWALPKTVEDFLDNLTIKVTNPYIFSIVTYGDKTYGTNGRVEQFMRRKGYHISYTAKIKCVENYLPMYKLVNTPKVQQRTEGEMDAVIRDLQAGSRNWAGTYTLLNKLIRQTYPAQKAGDCDERFHVKDCSGCGICEQICPRKNILMEDGKPSFKGNCELCLSCLHACPKTAIEWEKTKGKERYRNPNVSLNELLTSRLN